MQASPQLRADLASSRAAVQELSELVDGQPNTALGELLTFASDHRLVDLDPRLDAFLHPDGQHRDVVLDDQTRDVLEAMAQCAFAELSGHEAYIKQETPYSTQHGTKGAEFDRVVVVLDDDEGNFNLYSYDKLLGLKPLSDTDLKNRTEGKGFGDRPDTATVLREPMAQCTSWRICSTNGGGAPSARRVTRTASPTRPCTTIW